MSEREKSWGFVISNTCACRYPNILPKTATVMVRSQMLLKYCLEANSLIILPTCCWFSNLKKVLNRILTFSHLSYFEISKHRLVLSLLMIDTSCFRSINQKQYRWLFKMFQHVNVKRRWHVSWMTHGSFIWTGWKNKK